MKKNVYFYRIYSWFKHYLTAWNTGGEGVHSPYLFEWVRMVMADKHAYYVWKDIEAIREKMLHDTRQVDFVDYGSGKMFLGNTAKAEKQVMDIAKNSLSRKKYAQMLYRLINWLGISHGLEDGNKDTYSLSAHYNTMNMIGDSAKLGGLNIVELGTSLGITTAYLAAVDSRNRVVTCEGCPAVAEVAQKNWSELGLTNVECYVGELRSDSLQSIVDRLQGKIDVAFIDANHTYAGTREYFNVLADNVHDKSVIVVDDIHYNAEMEQAWQDICEDERVTSTIDLYQMGMVFFDRHYWRRNYTIRL